MPDTPMPPDSTNGADGGFGSDPSTGDNPNATGDTNASGDESAGDGSGGDRSGGEDANGADDEAGLDAPALSPGVIDGSSRATALAGFLDLFGPLIITINSVSDAGDAINVEAESIANGADVVGRRAEL